jgi:hypothetical protein
MSTMNVETKAKHMHMEKCKLQFGIYEDGEKKWKKGKYGKAIP